MISRRIRLRRRGLAALGLAVLCLASSGTSHTAAVLAADNSTKVFAGAQVREIYRINLDRDEGLLEAVNAAIKQYDIQDGAVLTTVGSTQECTYHYVKTTATLAEDVFVTQNGCKVLYLAEVTLAKFSGPQLVRRPNQNRIRMLEAR
jgi:hypothetical protein